MCLRGKGRHQKKGLRTGLSKKVILWTDHGAFPFLRVYRVKTTVESLKISFALLMKNDKTAKN